MLIRSDTFWVDSQDFWRWKLIFRGVLYHQFVFHPRQLHAKQRDWNLKTSTDQTKMFRWVEFSNSNNKFCQQQLNNKRANELLTPSTIMDITPHLLWIILVVVPLPTDDLLLLMEQALPLARLALNATHNTFTLYSSHSKFLVSSGNFTCASQTLCWGQIGNFS